MLGDLLELGVGLFSDSKNRKLTRRAQDMAQAQFNAQMDESVQRRVSDARKAGIHPLFALGASSGASPTMSAGSPYPANQAAVAAGRIASRHAEAQTRREEAEAALARSKAALIAQQAQSMGRDQADVQKSARRKGAAATGLPYEKVKPLVDETMRPGVAGGTNPFWKEAELSDGAVVLVPHEGTQMDELGQVSTGIQVALKQALKTLKPYYVPDAVWVKRWNTWIRDEIPEIVVREKKRTPRAHVRIKRPAWVPVKVWRAIGRALQGGK